MSRTPRPLHVYRNLHTGGWSIRYPFLAKGLRRTYRLSSVSLSDVDLRVQPAGRMKAIREKRRNVHSYAAGHAIGLPRQVTQGNRRERLHYSPFHSLGSFYVFRDGAEVAVRHAHGVIFDQRGRAWAYGAT